MGEANKMSSMTKKKESKPVKKTKEESHAELIEQIQSLCTHRRMGVFSEEGHNFVYCQDCNKRFYGMDI